MIQTHHPHDDKLVFLCITFFNNKSWNFIPFILKLDKQIIKTNYKCVDLQNNSEKIGFMCKTPGINI